MNLTRTACTVVVRLQGAQSSKSRRRQRYYVCKQAHSICSPEFQSALPASCCRVCSTAATVTTVQLLQAAMQESNPRRSTIQHRIKRYKYAQPTNWGTVLSLTLKSWASLHTAPETCKSAVQRFEVHILDMHAVRTKQWVHNSTHTLTALRLAATRWVIRIVSAYAAPAANCRLLLMVLSVCHLPAA